MSKRMETIKRLAETDEYWKGYLDGMRHTREADAAEWGEYARLAEARLDRAEKPHRALFMSDKISMDEARVKASIERSAAAQAVLDSISAGDWDNERSPAPPTATKKRL